MKKLKRIAGAMTVSTNGNLLFDGFVKVIVGLVATIYFFGTFLYPDGRYAFLDVIFILGLSFRFFFVIDSRLPLWKMSIPCTFYITIMLDQIIDVVYSHGSLYKILNSSSTILLFALISILILDIWQYRKTHIQA